MILGGGGHAGVLIELIGLAARYEAAGVLDNGLERGTEVMGLRILGGDELLEDILKTGVKYACIGLGGMGERGARRRLFHRVKDVGFSVPPLVHPEAIVSSTAWLAEGVQVMAGAVVQTKTRVGENTIVNTGSVIDHDCLVGRESHICPGVVLSGGVIVGEGAFVGAGARIIHGVRVGDDSVIAAGSVVIRDVPARSTVMGVPAR